MISAVKGSGGPRTLGKIGILAGYSEETHFIFYRVLYVCCDVLFFVQTMFWE